MIHLAGNLALFKNDGGLAFNNYSSTLRSLPVIPILEIGLGLGFLLHIIQGVRLWWLNRSARSEKYKINTPSKGSSIFSRTMVYTGSITFIFLVIHLRSYWYTVITEGHEVDLFNLVKTSFQDPVYSGFYIVAMALLGFHLNHGFQSAFQTFGWNHVKYFPFIQKAGTLYAILMAVGFASMPVYFLLGGQ